jgi:hypothetical protein
MGKVILVLLLIVVVVAAVGFYMDWFHFRTTTDTESGKVKGTFEIDKNKIKSDAEKARQKLGGSGTTSEKPSGQ